jgi:hypothetical protein
MMSLPIPPQALIFSSNRAAISVTLFNTYLGCVLSRIATTDENPAAQESEAFYLTYQTLCISEGLLGQNKEPSETYSPYDDIGSGISSSLYRGAQFCFSRTWQRWIIAALRSLGHKGLYGGHVLANTLEIATSLGAASHHQFTDDESNDSSDFYLGPIHNRLVPVLMPRGENDYFLAYFLRYDTTKGVEEADDTNSRIIATATWRQELSGVMQDLNIKMNNSTIAKDLSLLENQKDIDFLFNLQRAVEKGWHGYITV